MNKKDSLSNSSLSNVRSARYFALATLLALAMTYSWRAVSYAQDQPRSIGSGFYQMCLPSEKATLEQGRDVEISVSGKLSVSGELAIIVRDVNEISVDLSATFRADDLEQASEMMSTGGAKLLSTDKGMHLSVHIDPSVWTLAEHERLNLEMTVTVPLATRINIDAPNLEVISNGALAALTINETFESVEVAGARGIVRVDSRNGYISVSDLVGGFDVRTSNAKITLTDIEIAGGSDWGGNVRVSRARTEDGKIDIRRYTGPLHARTARADISIQDVMLTGNRNWIENSGGTIDVTFSGIEQDARLDVRNSYEDIQLTFSRDLSATFSLRTKDGKAITFESLPHKIIDVRENKIEAECGAGEALIVVRAKYGGAIIISGNAR